jgi:hypothetical protein
LFVNLVAHILRDATVIAAIVKAVAVDPSRIATGSDTSASTKHMVKDLRSTKPRIKVMNAKIIITPVNAT